MSLTVETHPTVAAATSGPSCAANPWYAVRVRSRYEFTTSGLLREKGLEYFLPSYRSRRLWSDRVKELDVPLFAGYVFCRFDFASMLRVLTTPGVMDIVSAGKTPIPVDEGEISALQEICSSGVPVEPWPYLQRGRQIVIERGPLAGAEGIVVEMKGRWRLIASISILHRSVAAEIDREWIRPVL